MHGCFWHGHDCELFRLPGTRQEFWSDKIERNRQRDRVVQERIAETGLRSITVWECAIRGPNRLGLDETALRISCWLRSDYLTGEIRAPKIEGA